MNLFWILSISLIGISFVGIIVLAKFLSKPIDDENISLLRTFPFEAKNNSIFKGNIYLIFIYIFSILCFSPLFLITDGLGSLENLKALSLIIAGILGLNGIIFVFVNIFDVTHVKVHLYLFTLFAFLSMLEIALIFARAFVAYKVFIEHGNQSPVLLINMIFSGILFLLVAIICLNPKLKSWAKLEEIPGDKLSYKRPKKFVLAYSEWALFISLFLSEILYFFQLLIK